MTLEILEALDTRKQNYFNEDWLVIINSDHGGGGAITRDHCPSTKEDQRTFMLVSGGKTVPGEMN